MNLKNTLINNNEQKLLVCLFLSNNHLSNVNTLQSIYRQQQGNITLCIISNGLLDFQCERFLYNLNVNRPQSIKQVYLRENLNRNEICNCIKELVDKFDSDYLLILRAGEYFKDEAIKKLYYAMNSEENKTINVFSFELQNNKQVLRIRTIASLQESDCEYWKDYKESMFVYDAKIFKSFALYGENDYVQFARYVVPELLSKGEDIMFHNFSLCFQNGEIREFETK